MHFVSILREYRFTIKKYKGKVQKSSDESYNGPPDFWELIAVL